MTTYHGSIDPASLPAGSYTATVVAIDASSNANETDTTPITLAISTAGIPPTGKPGRPAIRYEIAFGQPPFTVSPTWSDVTDDVYTATKCQITRGTPPDNPQPAAGSVSFTLLDQERKYDPDNADGPYYGQLTPLCPCRVTAVYANAVPQPLDGTAPLDGAGSLDGGLGTTTVPLGYGYIDSFSQSYAPPEHADKYVLIPIIANDALAILARTSFMPAQPFTWAPNNPPDGFALDSRNPLDSATPLDGGTYPDYMRWDTGAVWADPIPYLDQQRSGQRIYSRLIIAGIPDDFLDIDDGLTIVEEGEPKEQYLLDHIRTVTATEFGRFYQAADGTIRFVQRNPGGVRATFGEWTDVKGGMQYASLEYDPADKRLLVNRCRRSSNSVAEVLVQDEASIRNLGVFEDQQALAFSDPQDALDQANYIVNRRSRPSGRATAMTVKPDRNAIVIFPPLLAMDVGAPYTTSRTPRGIGDPIRKTVTAEQFTHEFNQKEWLTTVSLDEADTTSYLTWDDPELGAWDAGNVWAY